MTKASKFVLGVASLIGGGALVVLCGVAIVEGLAHNSGLQLLNLAGFFGGLFGIGGAADLLGPPRAPAAPREAVALSIWGARAHVDQWDIGE
jgi:hypothetical protein